MPKSQKPRKSQSLVQIIGDRKIEHKPVSWEQRLINAKYGFQKAVRLGLV